MHLHAIKLDLFRNYEHIQLENFGQLTIFIGKNGIGKTNILEAISLMTATQSFRRGQIAQFILQGKSQASIAAELGDGNRELSLKLQLEAGKKIYTLNGKRKKTGEIRGILPAVSFTPDHLELVKKSSSVKRDALDALGMQLSAHYYAVRHDYEKVIRYKNRLLKEEAPRNLIESINETLITCGSQLFCFRLELLRRLDPLVKKNYLEIAQLEFTGGKSPEGHMTCIQKEASSSGSSSGSPSSLSGLSIQYLASWNHMRQNEKFTFLDKPLKREEIRDILRENLELFYPDERRRMRSLIGPHNDKINFYLDNSDVSVYASQGQQRSIVLAWKLAELQEIRQSTGNNPLLLLDDVMSELDSFRREALVRFITDDVQSFITATDLSCFHPNLLENAQIIELPKDL